MVKIKFLLSLLLLIVFTSSLQFKKLNHQFLKGSIQAFRNAELQKHNQFRDKHGAPPLELDDELNDVAQQYAEHLADIDTMVHSGGEYGQNLYWAWASPARAYKNGAATQAWYDQIKDYNFSDPDSSTGVTGHFTQVVWVGSQRVGFGIASVNGADYVVANYDPPGNWQGDYESNVLQG